MAVIKPTIWKAQIIDRKGMKDVGLWIKITNYNSLVMTTQSLNNHSTAGEQGWFRSKWAKSKGSPKQKSEQRQRKVKRILILLRISQFLHAHAQGRIGSLPWRTFNERNIFLIVWTIAIAPYPLGTCFVAIQAGTEAKATLSFLDPCVGAW
ncbi:hypothetical protein F4703DRAFT_1920121 [Phycomyces blakesleeanus]